MDPRFEAPIGLWRSPRAALLPGASPICQRTRPRRICWQHRDAPRCTSLHVVLANEQELNIINAFGDDQFVYMHAPFLSASPALTAPARLANHSLLLVTPNPFSCFPPPTTTSLSSAYQPPMASSVLPSNGCYGYWKNEAFRRTGSNRRWLSGAGHTGWLWVAVPTICPPLRGHCRPRVPRSPGYLATTTLWPHRRLWQGTTGRAWGPTGRSTLPLSAARPLRPAIKLAGRRLLVKGRLHRRASRWVRVRHAPFQDRRWHLMPLSPTIRGPSARAARSRVARGRRLVGPPTLWSTRGCLSPTFCVGQMWLLGSWRHVEWCHGNSRAVWVVIVASIFNSSDLFDVPTECTDGGINPNSHSHVRTGETLEAKWLEVRLSTFSYLMLILIVVKRTRWQRLSTYLT